MTDNERIAVLEANYKHMEAQQIAMAEKVDEIHDILTQAKGAKWIVISVVGFMMAIVTVVVKFFPTH